MDRILPWTWDRLDYNKPSKVAVEVTNAIGPNGKLVFVGTLTAGSVNLASDKLYEKHAQIIGTPEEPEEN
jgi:hypothetical protein